MQMRLNAALGIATLVGCGPTANQGAGSETGSTTSTTSDAGHVDTSTGGEPDGAPVGPFGSGTRLRARYLEAPGGARAFHSFFDTELGVPCRFHEVAPDDYRCLPDAEAGPPPPRQVWALPLRAERPWVYLDSQCTQPAYEHSECLPNIGDVFVTGPQDILCGPRPSPGMPAVYVETVTEAYRRNPVTGACETILIETDEAVYAYELTDPLVYVHAELVDEDGARRVVADDGAFVVWHLHDADGQPCDIADPALDVCIPAVAGYTLGDNAPPTPDLTCETFHAFTNGCEPPTHAVNYDAFDEVRPILGPCPERNPGNFDIWQVGDPIPADELTTLSRMPMGEGSVVAEYHLDERGEPTLFARWWDDAHQVACDARRYGGQWWCLPWPRIASYGSRYADFACTVEFWLDDTPDLLAVANSASGCAGQTLNLFEPVPFDGPVYEMVDGECVPDGSGVGALAGEPLPLSAVATPLQLQTE